MKYMKCITHFRCWAQTFKCRVHFFKCCIQICKGWVQAFMCWAQLFTCWVQSFIFLVLTLKTVEVYEARVLGPAPGRTPGLTACSLDLALLASDIRLSPAIQVRFGSLMPQMPKALASEQSKASNAVFRKGEPSLSLFI